MNSSRNKSTFGYMNKVLFIDLSTKRFKTERLGDDTSRLFFGGRGLGVSFLCSHFFELEKQGRYKNAFLEVDPLSPDNVIVVSTSPTTGTRMPTSGRVHMNYKSPLTGALGSTNAGGRWGVDFKKTGHDVLVISGKAQHPVYLAVTNSGVDFYNADHLTGLNSIEIREEIKKKLNQKIQVLTIGPAGRNLSMFAAVLTDKGKALGRGGSGAVFGSKNLFAVAVNPESGINIKVANEGALTIKNKEGAAFYAKMKLDLGKFTKKEKMYGVLSSMGSLGLLGMVNNFDQLIHNNMRDTCHKQSDIDKIDGEALRNHAKRAKTGETRIEVKKGSCFNCPIICKRHTRLIDENGNLIEKGEGPEFESVTLMGANLSIYDLTIITRANYLANQYGLDTISLGGTIASFFDLYNVIKVKKGNLLPKEQLFISDTEDFVIKHGEPDFGKADMLLPIVHLVGTATGIGKYLAEGSYRFCERYGHTELSMSIKKMELPAYDPRTTFTQALCYEMNNRGGCHLEGGYTAPQAYCAGYAEWPGNRTEGTPLVAKNATLKNVTLDVIGACVYGSLSLGLDEYASLINAVTGDKYDSGSLKKLAERTITLERMFNLLCGLDHSDDWLPARFYNQAIQVRGKPVVCNRDEFKKMHVQYYKSVGWDETGIPTKQTLEKLELLSMFPKLGLAVQKKSDVPLLKN